MKRMFTRIAAATTLIIGLGGCGTEQPPVCDQLAAVQATMHQIRNANVSENGLAVVKANLQQLRVDVRLLVNEAAAQFASEVEVVQAAADQVSTSVAAAQETPDFVHVSEVRATLGALRSSVDGLGDAMAGTC